MILSIISTIEISCDLELSRPNLSFLGPRALETTTVFDSSEVPAATASITDSSARGEKNRNQ